MADGVSVGSLYYDLNIDDKNLGRQLDANDKQVKDFGDSVQDTGEKVKDNLNKVAKGFAIVGAGLTLVSKNATDFTMQAVGDAKNLGREIGVTTTEASRLTAAFRRMGLEGSATSSMFGIFSKNIVSSTENAEQNKLAVDKLKLQIEATKKQINETTAEIKKNGDKSGDLNLELRTLNNTLATQQDALNKTADGFSKLGISTKDAKGQQKGFVELLFEVADQFKAMPDGTKKTALALELFGRSGKDMIKVLNLGSEGIQDLEKRADELGLTLNEKTINDVAAYVQATKDMQEQTDALKLMIGQETIPVMTMFKGTINDVLQSLLTTDGAVKTVTVSILAFGGPVLGAGAAVLTFAANLATVITALAGTQAGVIALQALSLTGWAALVAADLYLIVKAAQAVIGAFKALDAADAAQNAANKSNDVALNRAKQQYKEGKITKERLNAIIAGSNASGTENWRGGLTWVHENGPEIIDLPRGTRIIPHTLSKEIVKNDMSRSSINVGDVYINSRADADYFFEKLNRKSQLRDMGVSP